MATDFSKYGDVIEETSGESELTDFSKYGEILPEEAPPEKPKTTYSSVIQKVGNVGKAFGNVMGGAKIGQGIGQALANKQISKQIDETMNQSFEIQGKLLQSIKEKKAKGENTQRLEIALRNLNEDIISQSGGVEELMNQGKLTKKQVLGDALQMATTLASFGTYGKAASAMATGKLGKALPSVLKLAPTVTGKLGVKTIATELAKGTVKGALSGSALFGAGSAASSLKQDKSNEDILKDTLQGAKTGAKVGAVTGFVSAGLQLKKAANTLKNLQNTSKTLSKVEETTANLEGRVKTSLGGKKVILPSKTEKRAAEILQGRISSDPTKNPVIIHDEIAKRGAEIEKALESKSVPISAQKQADMFATERLKMEKILDKTQLKAFDEQVRMFAKQLPGRGGFNTANFYKGLKDYEQNVASNLPRGMATLVDPTGVASAKIQGAKTVRKVVREVIGNYHPEFKGKMFDLASLYDVMDTALTKSRQLTGNTLSRLIRSNPVATGAAKVGAGLLIGKTILSKIGSQQSSRLASTPE